MKKALLMFLVFLFCPIFILAADKIEINTASLQQLDGITGIGPALAQRIIDARPYSSVDDLLKVKGIGEKTLQDIKTQGLAYVSGQTQSSTPVAQNSPGTPENIEPVKESAPAVTASIEPASPTYQDGVVINEVLPSPDGADETNEFIELYNSNGTDVDVSGWKLQDLQGTQTTYIFPTSTIIVAGGFLALLRPQTKILLNNDADGVNLLWPNGKIADTISYSGAITKQSYNKTTSGWQWSTTPTPGAKNTITAPVVVSKTKTKALPKAKKTDNKTSIASTTGEPLNLNSNIFTADLKQDTSNPWFLFMVAGAITLFSGIVFLIIKLILFKKNERSLPL